MSGNWDDVYNTTYASEIEHYQRVKAFERICSTPFGYSIENKTNPAWTQIGPGGYEQVFAPYDYPTYPNLDAFDFCPTYELHL